LRSSELKSTIFENLGVNSSGFVWVWRPNAM
jgi:hypothetical protein